MKTKGRIVKKKHNALGPFIKYLTEKYNLDMRTDNYGIQDNSSKSFYYFARIDDEAIEKELLQEIELFRGGEEYKHIFPEPFLDIRNHCFRASL